tara:strand:+ start:5534 stop:5932 length:399 start_codon:yes stop_codon:yes gene_type:complete
MRQISIKEVLDHLGKGVTRTKDGAGYVAELGSIEEKYDLSKTDVKEIFTHPLLKNRKTKPPKSFILIDDVTDQDTTSVAAEVPEKPKAYGTRPASSPSTGEVEIVLPTTASIEQESVSEEVIVAVEPSLTQD